MANRALALGEAGATKFVKRGERLRATAVLRLLNGQRVTVSASGANKREAEDKLHEVIGYRLGRPLDAMAIHGGTPLYVAAGQFFDQAYLEADRKDAHTKRKRQTVDFHAETWKSHLRPHLAEVMLRELTPTLLEHVFNQIRRGTPERPGSEAKARRAYTTLNLILGRAQLHGGLPVNPLSAVPRPKPQPKAVIALDAQGVGLIRAAVRQYDLKREAASRRSGGMRPTGNVVAVLDVLLGTGLRIGEALALRWCDVVQDDDRWWVDVNATLVQIAGRGLIRQEVPKTAASDRLVPLPQFTVDALAERRVAAENRGGGRGEDYLFPARGRVGQSGPTPQSRANWRRSLRAALTDQDLGELGFSPHVARKTVATVVARATGSDEIAGRLLGHQVSRSVTTLHYIERMRRAPDETATIQAFIELSQSLIALPTVEQT